MLSEQMLLDKMLLEQMLLEQMLLEQMLLEQMLLEQMLYGYTIITKRVSKFTPIIFSTNPVSCNFWICRTNPFVV